MLGLAYWDNGFKVMSANKPLREAKDFRGQKMRIQSSKVLDAQMRALGANPQVMAFSEVYQALQTGVVDGTENPPSNLYTQKMYEVQKYVTNSDHGYLGYAVIVNKAFWDGLPAGCPHRAGGGHGGGDGLRQRDRQAGQRWMPWPKVKESGKSEIIELTPEQKAEWKKASGQGAPRDGRPHRQGPDPVCLRGDRQRHGQALMS